MKKILKYCSAIISAIYASVLMTTTAFADDFVFDMAKAKQTYGGGQSYVSYTRLDNEKRDANKFNPLWITKDSIIEIEYDVTEKNSDVPLRLVMQSWTGELVDGTEEKWIQIEPSSVKDNIAYFTYDDLVNAYGDNFSDVYSFVIEDAGNAIKATSFKITNCDIPLEDISTIKGGSVYRDGILIDGSEEILSEITTSETTIEETEKIEETTETIEKETTISETEIVSSDEKETETQKEETSTTNSSSEETITSEQTENNSPNLLLIIIIAASVVVIAIVVIIIIVIKNKKNRRSYRKFK